MPKPKRVSPARDEADDADNMAASALTPALLKEMLTATISEEIASLRSEIIADIRASTTALQTTISSQGSKIKDIETSLNSVDERLGSLRQMIWKTVRGRTISVYWVIPENVETARPSHFMVLFFTELFGDKLYQTPEMNVHTGPSHRNRVPVCPQDP